MTMLRTFITVVATLAGCLLTTSHAFAYGVCARGQWVWFPPGQPITWTDESKCTCGNGLRGWSRVSVDWGINIGASGPTNGGAGIEREAVDNITGERTFLPIYFQQYPDAPICIMSPHGATWLGTHPPWYDAERFTVTRFRVVCVDNLANFEIPEGEWIWD